LSSPIAATIAIAIKLHDRGPVLYRGERVGQHGKVFRIHKFRTMVVNAESLGGTSTSDSDTRITPVGRLLRKYKLDELPQLWDVVVGDMSMVGPRPEVAAYVAQYTPEEKRILDVRPGITDWASIWNRDEGAVLEAAEDPDLAYERLIRPTKVALQLDYVDGRGLGVDVRVIYWTIRALLGSNRVPQEVRRYPALLPARATR
jgi:lipopolysaccharide/colanic/teichoic acid biosynthesis glycosyltransferase